MTTAIAAEDRAAVIARLKRVIHEIESRPARPVHVARPEPATGAAVPLEVALPGTTRRATAAGDCTYRELRLPPQSLVGEVPLDELRHVSAETFALLGPRGSLEGARLDEVLFLDIETTGLGGAGAVTFLVATARLEGADLVLRQYLALTPAEEAALLDALLEDTRLQDEPVLATYNGRTFDAPMLDGRAVMHRRRAGFEVLRQLDLLHPARTVFRGSLPSCRLADVESAMLRLVRREELGCDDVPGFQVPGWYFQWLRSGDGRWLAPLARHNEMDVLALAGLLGRLGAIVAGSVEASGDVLLGLGRLSQSRRHPSTHALLGRALAVLPSSSRRHEALAHLAAWHKSAGQPESSEPLWRTLADEPAADLRLRLSAFVELAKLYEHRRRDFVRALREVVTALALLDGGTRMSAPDRARWRAALDHRLARLERRARGSGSAIAQPIARDSEPAAAAATV